MTTDDSIRDALLQVADLAPDPVGICDGLERRARQYRQRRALLTAAVAAGVSRRWPGLRYCCRATVDTGHPSPPSPARRRYYRTGGSR